MFRVAKYTDGSTVQEGDHIRFKQAPGGILPVDSEWKYGVAKMKPYSDVERQRIEKYNADQGEICINLDELYLYKEESYYSQPIDVYYIISGGHIVERVDSE